MAYQPRDWLQRLIESELRAVITWHGKASSHGRVKREPNSRFDDDGSNFRSAVGSSLLPEGCALQIVKVISVEDPLLLVSDGFTSVRARLSTPALQSLEAEIGDPIDLDTRGDVFTVRKCTIISTPDGPTEAWVQLLIEDIEYHYHLRKVAGNSDAAGESPSIASLVNEVMRIRHPEEELDVADEASTTKGPLRASGRSDRFETQAGYMEPQSPQSQASIALASSPPVVATQPSKTKPTSAAKVPTKRKRTLPNLTKDGVEMEVGDNLALPTAAVPSRPAANQPIPGPAKPAAISNNNAQLLNMLSKAKAEPENQTPSTPSEPKRAAVSPSKPISPITSSHSPFKEQQLPLKPVGNTEPTSQITSASRPTMAPSKPSSKPWYRRGVPKDQLRLLDSPLSWLPPLPGRQFPHPNVPIDLLNQWKEQMRRKPKPVTLSQSQQPSNAKGSAAEPQSSSSYSSKDDDDSDNEQELPWSSSPARPAAHAIPPQGNPVGRAPHSSGNVGPSPIEVSSGESLSTSPAKTLSRPSTADERQELPPDSSFENAAAPRALSDVRAPQDNLLMQRKLAESPSLAKAVDGNPSASPSGPSLARAENRSWKEPFSRSEREWSPEGRFALSRPSQRLRRRGSRRSASPSDSRGNSRERRSSHMRPPSPHHKRSPRPAFAASQSSRTSYREDRRQGIPVGGDSYRPSSQRSPRESRRPSSRQEIDSYIPNYAASHLLPERPASRSISQAVLDTSPGQLSHVSQSPARCGPTPVAPPSTAATVIKATQPSRNSVAEKDERHEAEMKKSGPRDPGQDHQQLRSEYFKGVQRRKWIKANYTPDRKKPLRLGALLSAYKKDHPKDQPRLSELAEALHAVYPDANEDHDQTSSASRTTEARKSSNDVASTMPAQISPADSSAADTTPTKFSTQPVVARDPNGTGVTKGRNQRNEDIAAAATVSPPDHSMTNDGNSKVSDPVSLDGTNERENVPVSSKRQLAVPKPVSTGKERRAAAKQMPSADRAKPASASPKSAPDHHTWFVKRLESDQRRLQSEGRSRSKDGSVYTEFASAWREIAPGGAFATSDGAEKGRKAGRLSVLDWEL